MKDATILLDQMTMLIRLAATHEDARKQAWQLHGAATMAYRLGFINNETWERYDETADTLTAEKLAAERQLSLLDD